MQHLPSVRFSAALLVAMSLTACSGKIEWTEEVRLQSGDTLVVHRSAKSKPFGQIGGTGGWENEGMTMLIVQPATPANPPTWGARFVPLLFDRDAATGQWFIVATFYSCTSWYDLGRPSLPYTEFRLEGGRWVQRPLTQGLIGRKGNMLTSINSKGEPNHTLASKEAVMSDPRIAREYQEVVGKWSTNC